MSKLLDPLVSEFDTEPAAEDYDRWFRAKVREALESTKPRLTHDEAVLRVRALLERKRKSRVLAVRWADEAVVDLAEIIA